MRNIIILILGIWAITQMSCYTPKRLGKQLHKGYITYPGQVADSAARWYPVVIVDSVIEEELIEAVDSSEYYKNRFDSLQKEMWSEVAFLDTVYRDTCTSVKKIYTSGYNKGYGMGLNKGLQDCIPDTLRQKRLIIKESTAKVWLAEKRAENALREQEKWRQRFYIALGVSVLLLILLLIGYILNRRRNA